MKLRILFTATTRRQLRTLWKQAYDRGDVRLVRRLSALLAYDQGQEVEQIAADLSVAAEPSISGGGPWWLTARRRWGIVGRRDVRRN